MSPEVVTSIAIMETPFYIKEDTAYFHSLSNPLGWHFLYATNKEALTPPYQNILMLILPFMILVFILASLMSIFISFGIYRPIQKLVDLAEKSKTSQNNTSKNEFDLISTLFTEMNTRQNELDHALHNVSKDVLTRLFLDLFSSDQKNATYVDEILKQTGSTFKIGDFYCVVLLQCNSNFHAFQQQPMTILSEIKSILNVFLKKNNASSHIIETDSLSYVIILSFDSNDSLFRIKNVLMNDLTISIGHVIDHHNLPLEFSIGKLHKSLLDVGFS